MLYRVMGASDDLPQSKGTPSHARVLGDLSQRCAASSCTGAAFFLPSAPKHAAA